MEKVTQLITYSAKKHFTIVNFFEATRNCSKTLEATLKRVVLAESFPSLVNHVAPEKRLDRPIDDGRTGPALRLPERTFDFATLRVSAIISVRERVPEV